MNKNSANALRGWILVLSFAVLAAGFLIANLQDLQFSLIFLSLLLVVVAAGLLTNIWGGLAASGIAVLALTLFYQYVGMRPVQNGFTNVASELAVFLVVGPLGGWLSGLVETAQGQINHWISAAEGRAAHDRTLHVLKPEWGRVRLAEEVVRATCYARPLSVALLQVADIAGANRPERVAALQALIRIARAATSAPTVVAYFGENRVLLILPEHTEETAQQLLARIRARAEKEIYFPEGVEGLGRPLQESGKLLMAVAAVDSKRGSPEALLESAAAGLQS